MNERSAGRRAWGIAWSCVALTLAAVAFSPASGLSVVEGFRPHEAIIGTLFPLIGAMIVSRERGNAVGWVMIAAGISWGLDLAVTMYSWYAGVTHPGTPGAALTTWLSQWDWMPGTALILVFLLLLFPDGHLPTRRWRPFRWFVLATTAVAVVGSALGSWPYRGRTAYLSSRADTLPGTASQIGSLAFLAIFLCSFPAAFSLFFRYRQARGEHREQIRLVAYAGLVVVVATFADIVILNTNGSVTALPIALLPIAIGVAILRHGLYDINLVIKKTLVFAAIALAVAGAFFALVAGLGLSATSGASARAALLVGLAMGVFVQPIGRVARRVSTRIVYGKRATPYEVLTGFSHRLGDAFATEDVLERMAQLLRGAIGAELARVWLRVGGELRVVASAPDAPAPGASSLSGDELPDLGEPHAYEVRDRGELLGALTATLPANDPMNPAKDKLVRDLASQAGLVLRNVRLIEELRASRQRLVAAQDEERRKIERNLHDGAQQQLVALSVKLRLAEQLAERDPTKAMVMLADLQTETAGALENLRDLARGIYPPLLADQGLAAALQAQARKSPVPTTVESDGVGRYPPDIEATVYFCTLEALQNVAKYAGASETTVRLSELDGHLVFEITDDGSGFDTAATGYGTGMQGMADRLDALGGGLEVTSSIGSGTTVLGRLPAAAIESVR